MQTEETVVEVAHVTPLVRLNALSYIRENALVITLTFGWATLVGAIFIDALR